MRPTIYAARRGAALVASAAFVVATGCGYDAATSSYDPAPTPIDTAHLGALWLAGGLTPAIFAIDSAHLRSSGPVPPAVTLTTGSSPLSTVNAIAFDSTGTLWLASADDSLLLAFAPSHLGASGAHAADIVLSTTARSLSAPTALAFDRQHRLWVANVGNGTLVRFDRAALAASGHPAPAVTITTSLHPWAMAFDAAGTLWVADVQANRISGYTAAQLAASGAPEPAVVLRTNTVEHSLVVPTALAFDAAGNLWVSTVGTGRLESFAPSQLLSSGTPAPRLRITSDERSIAIPVGLAFDDQGSLWVVNDGGFLSRFPRAQLDSSGAPIATTRLRLDQGASFSSLAFWPHPAGLPLH